MDARVTCYTLKTLIIWLAWAMSMSGNSLGLTPARQSPDTDARDLTTQATTTGKFDNRVRLPHAFLDGFPVTTGD